MIYGYSARRWVVLLLLCMMVRVHAGGRVHEPAHPYVVPKEKPDRALSAAMERSYTAYLAPRPEHNELYSQFKYTKLQGFDYNNHDGTISRRDPSKVIFANDKYYVWYTHRHTPIPPQGAKKCTDTIPSTDWDLADIWYATSEDGFTWDEQGVAVPRPVKPHVGWRSVTTTDILVWKGKYHLYYQGFMQASGTRGDDCPVAVSYADSPDGPWTPYHKIVIPNGARGEWDQYSIHDPYPLIYKGKIYLYYKSDCDGDPRLVRMQGLAIADRPLGPFRKHPLNPVISSGHETTLFPFKDGIAALVIRDGNEHNTVQFAKDGVNFEIASIVELMPNAAGPFVPDAFKDTKDGRGITWGLSHFTNVTTWAQNHSALVRFDCDLSQDLHDPDMKKHHVYHRPEVYYKQGMNQRQRTRIMEATRRLRQQSSERATIPEIVGDYVLIYKPQPDIYTGKDTKHYKAGETYTNWQPNDHTFIKGPDNRWHCFGITRPNDVKDDGIHEGEGFCFHAVAPLGELEHAFRPRSWMDRPKLSISGCGWAPYAIKIGNAYSLISSQTGHAESTDLYTWKDKGKLSIKGGNRDPNIMYWNGTYYLVRCNDRVVTLVTSRDFVNWSEPVDIFTAPAASWNCESPTLMRYNETFYLFWCLWDIAGSGAELPALYAGHDPSTYDYRTYVYTSETPMNFHNRSPVTELKAHAPEIVQGEKGDYFISSADYPQRGINLARLVWKSSN